MHFAYFDENKFSEDNPYFYIEKSTANKYTTFRCRATSHCLKSGQSNGKNRCSKRGGEKTKPRLDSLFGQCWEMLLRLEYYINFFRMYIDIWYYIWYI